MFEFGEWIVGHELCAFHKSWVVYLCTCARAHRASASREWLGRLCSNLVFGLGVINKVLSTSHGWVASARAHVRTPFPCLGNCWVHCAEIWWVIRVPVAMCFMQVPVAMCFMQVFGHLCTCARAHLISVYQEPIDRLC